jgi:hypothetical protein
MKGDSIITYDFFRLSYFFLFIFSSHVIAGANGHLGTPRALFDIWRPKTHDFILSGRRTYWGDTYADTTWLTRQPETSTKKRFSIKKTKRWSDRIGWYAPSWFDLACSSLGIEEFKPLLALQRNNCTSSTQYQKRFGGLLLEMKRPFVRVAWHARMEQDFVWMSDASLSKSPISSIQKKKGVFCLAGDAQQLVLLLK